MPDEPATQADTRTRMREQPCHPCCKAGHIGPDARECLAVLMYQYGALAQARNPSSWWTPAPAPAHAASGQRRANAENEDDAGVLTPAVNRDIRQRDGTLRVDA